MSPAPPSGRGGRRPGAGRPPVAAGAGRAETALESAPCDELEMQDYHPANSLVGVARHLMSLQSSQLRLNALLLDDRVFESVDALLERVGWHYAMQVLQGAYRLVGSLDLLGNPASIFSDLGGGVRQSGHREEICDRSSKRVRVGSGESGRQGGPGDHRQ